MLSRIKPKTEPVLIKLVKPISFIPPNIMTILGLVFPILFFIALLNQNYLIAILLIILSVFDTLDGVVARRTGKVTPFGGLLDSSLDRIADGIYIAAFGFANIVDWWLIISLLITSYLISYIRSRAELAGEGKFKLDVGIIERPERIATLVLVTTLIYFGLNQTANQLLLLLLLLSTITVLHRFIAAYKLLKI